VTQKTPTGILISIFLATMFNRGHQEEKRLQDTKILVLIVWNGGGGRRKSVIVDETNRKCVSVANTHLLPPGDLYYLYMNKK
jgi:hypothetical protein